MATITNKTSGIEIVFGGATTYIKHGNVKLLKRVNNLNIYDDSEEASSTGQVYMSLPFSEVTSPSEANIDDLYNTIRGYVDVASGGGGGVSNPSFSTLNVPNGTQTSSNTWYCTKQMMPFDISLNELEINFSAVGTDLVTIGIWSEDRTTLIDSSLPVTTILNTTIAPVNGATLLGGTSYWIGAKCSAGISNFFKNTAVSDSEVSISFFDLGTPTSIPDTAGIVAPKISLKG